MGASVAAVVLLVQERRIVDAFARAGAVTPAYARSFDDLSVDGQARATKRLRRRAIVREAAPGLFYADLDVWRSMRRSRRRMQVVVLAVAAALYVAKLLGVWH